MTYSLQFFYMLAITLGIINSLNINDENDIINHDFCVVIM